MSTREGACIADVVEGRADWIVVCADNLFAMGGMPDKCIDVVITDPPYSEQVHRSVRSSKRNEMPDVQDFRCRTRRAVDLGFEHITADEIEAQCDAVERVCRRWFAVFSDVEPVTCGARQPAGGVKLQHVRGLPQRAACALQLGGDQMTIALKNLGRPRMKAANHASAGVSPAQQES